MCFWKIKTPVNPQLFVLLRIYRGLFLHFTNVLTELSQQERYFFSQCCCFFSLGHLVSCECHLDLMYKRVFACCFLQIAERFFWHHLNWTDVSQAIAPGSFAKESVGM